MSTPTSGEMRRFVRETAEAYLDPMTDPARVDVAQMAIDRKLAFGPEAKAKIHRYALATAASHLLLSSAIEGAGIEAQFRFQRDRLVHVNPIQDLGNAVRHAVKTTGDILTGYSSRFNFLLNSYVALSRADSEATVRFSGFIVEGGSLPTEGSEFVGVSAVAMEESPLINPFDGDVRALAAHGLMHIATGTATDNVGVISRVPTWMKEANRGIQLIGRNNGYTLKGSDGRRLFSLPSNFLDYVNYSGPNLHCPAHQLLFDNLDTALELGIHATINLGHDRGLYDNPDIGTVLQNYPSYRVHMTDARS